MADIGGSGGGGDVSGGGGGGFEQPGGGFGGESAGLGGGMGGFGSTGSAPGTDTGGMGLGTSSSTSGSTVSSGGIGATSTGEPTGTVSADPATSVSAPATSSDIIDAFSGDPQGTLAQTMASLPASVSYGPSPTVVNGTVVTAGLSPVQQAVLGLGRLIPGLGAIVGLAAKYGPQLNPGGIATAPGPTEPGSAALSAIGGGGGGGLGAELGAGDLFTSQLSGTSAAGGTSSPSSAGTGQGGLDPAGAGGSSPAGTPGTLGSAFGTGTGGGGLADILGNLLASLGNLFAPAASTSNPASTSAAVPTDQSGGGGGTVDMGGGGVTYLPTSTTARSPLALLVVLAGLALVGYYVYQRQRHKRAPAEEKKE